MNRLQLATLLSWAGHDGFKGRKRLQKVVFFLQQAGCPLDCNYTLHHFGPYSRDVADACDEMVAAGLVTEHGPSRGDFEYSYELTHATLQLLQMTSDSSLQEFEELAKNLIREDLRTLELGSTILFFYQHTNDWQRAKKSACQFKKVDCTVSANEAALILARKIHEDRAHR